MKFFVVTLAALVASVAAAPNDWNQWKGECKPETVYVTKVEYKTVKAEPIKEYKTEYKTETVTKKENVYVTVKEECKNWNQWGKSP